MGFISDYSVRQLVFILFSSRRAPFKKSRRRPLCRDRQGDGGEARLGGAKALRRGLPEKAGAVLLADCAFIPMLRFYRMGGAPCSGVFWGDRRFSRFFICAQDFRRKNGVLVVTYLSLQFLVFAGGAVSGD